MDRSSPTHEAGFDEARQVAARRHNAVLRAHAGSPVSYGLGIYVLCSCGAFKGTFAAFEEHCQRAVVDASVAAK